MRLDVEVALHVRPKYTPYISTPRAEIVFFHHRLPWKGRDIFRKVLGTRRGRTL